MKPVRLYCGTYNKYNSGSAYGKWMVMNEYENAKAFFDACRAVHSDETDPEFMFQDYEYVPKVLCSEALGAEEIERIIQYAKKDEKDRRIVQEYLNYYGYPEPEDDIDEILSRFIAQPSDLKMDESTSLAKAYGMYLVEEQGTVPKHLRRYINYEEYGQVELDDLVVTEADFIFEY